ncbi:MAG: polysulfide reductase NrfD [Magnetococcales bacterium]|nr:polysulfide reductase NrfD [Magnetococcales bacterium]
MNGTDSGERGLFSALLVHQWRSPWQYRFWMAGWIAVLIWGGGGWIDQLRHGLSVTGLDNRVVWGLYIGNFTFLVGVAAAAVILVVPAYLMEYRQVRKVTLLGESLAIAAVTMSLLFVFVDIGRPERIWHALPLLGSLHFPASILAWDMVVLSLYLLLNTAIVLVLLRAGYRGETLSHRRLMPWIVAAVVLGIGIHTVTAFMLSGLPARPYWNSAVLAPRFIASAFAAGAGMMLLLFHLLNRLSAFSLEKGVVSLLTGVLTFSLWITLYQQASELFVHSYGATVHTVATQWLWSGEGGVAFVTDSVRFALLLELVAVVVVTLPGLRRRGGLLMAASLMTVIAIWLEKGMGLVIPGLLPTPLGEMGDYAPTFTEIRISLGVWAVGILLFSSLARAVIGVEQGTVRAFSDA